MDAFEINADVGISAAVEKMFAEVLGHFPRLDILVNNAGIQTSLAIAERYRGRVGPRD